MLSDAFLGIALLGAEWVLYVLLFLSIISVSIILERVRFYANAKRELEGYRGSLRKIVTDHDWSKALELTRVRNQKNLAGVIDFETPMTQAMLEYRSNNESNRNDSFADSLGEIASDAINRTRLRWEKNLAILATIGSNAPFVGLFGTVLGIIQAFNELSDKSGAGSHSVMAGISEALVATAVGILVAIPAVAAYNLFQRKVRTALTEAEALKSFMISQMSN